jgi:hypothetical protein
LVVRWRSRWLIVGAALLLMGCASQVAPNRAAIDETCGNPTRFPVSQECVALMGDPDGSLLQRKSDLTMAVWRACPSTDPCGRLEACQKAESVKPDNPKFETRSDECARAQQTDYSCSSLQKDPEYVRRSQAISECVKNLADDPRCAGPVARHDRPRTKRWKSALAREMACYDRCLPSDSAPDCKQAQAALGDFQDGRVQK